MYMNALLRASIQMAGLRNTAFCARLKASVSVAVRAVFSLVTLTAGNPWLCGES